MDDKCLKQIDAKAKDPTKYLALKYSVTKLNKRIVNAQRAVENLQANLEEFCPHNNTVKVEHNIPGGYLNRSEHRTDTYCSYCGKLLITGFTQFGSFG